MTKHTGVIRHRERSAINEKSGRAMHLLETGLCTILGAYLLSCVPNSIKASKELEPIAREFVQIAENTKAERKTVNIWGEETTELDYQGRLEGIVKKRDGYLAQNGCIQVTSWIAREGNYGTPYTETSSLVFCKNPIREIIPYKKY